VTAALFKKMVTLEAKEDVRYKFVGYVNTAFELSLTIKVLTAYQSNYSVLNELNKQKEIKREKDSGVKTTPDSIFKGESMLRQAGIFTETH
jgi:hypothetical protein